MPPASARYLLRLSTFIFHFPVLSIIMVSITHAMMITQHRNCVGVSCSSPNLKAVATVDQKNVARRASKVACLLFDKFPIAHNFNTKKQDNPGNPSRLY